MSNCVPYSSASSDLDSAVRTCLMTSRGRFRIAPFVVCFHPAVEWFEPKRSVWQPGSDAPTGHCAGAMARVKASLLASALRDLDPRHALPFVWHLSERRAEPPFVLWYGCHDRGPPKWIRELRGTLLVWLLRKPLALMKRVASWFSSMNVTTALSGRVSP